MAVLALFPGSFDPFTEGHEAILRRVLPLFDKVVVAVGVNSEKAERDRSGANLPQGKPMYLLNLDGFFNPFLEQLRQMHQMGFVRAGGEASLHSVDTIDDLLCRIS